MNQEITNNLQQAVTKGLIRFYDDNKRIEYIHQNKSRNYSNPEEQVQAETYCRLILEYGYPVQRIKLFVTVSMGVDKKEADIVVYNDDECLQPHILVECKKQEISEQEFIQAIEQAYSYAFALPNQVKYAWVTSKIKNVYFRLIKVKIFALQNLTFLPMG